ncbi:hypothetical protein GBF38_012099 [Nibea albiflora]|uniref:Uncharacterized protein n=1 Tax=Nibea albiflora TaxID=240163 RepID=A0ACB7EIX9_NIBAL|nr:hypothetical protein GBF38_012099 [Nibea albiflora]
MAGNNSLIGGGLSSLPFTDRVIIVQFLVIMFLSINFLLIMTFFRKECFYTTTRYILFAVTLFSDSLMLFVSNILLILTYLEFTLQVWICIIISVVVLVYNILTPVTLTAMTLERYVAICMPLRHAELCSTRSTMHCILIIHGLSSVPCIVVLSTFFASASIGFYAQSKLCSVETFMLYRWQDHVWSAVHQFYFLIMVIIILFSYVKIMKVAKAASGEDKKSSWKGLKTVILHGFQLLLCLIQLWTPFIEAAAFQIDFMLFIDFRKVMADNNSSAGGRVSVMWNDNTAIIVQFLVTIFLCINILLILTFFRKECFYTTTRYILFAVTLLSDSLILVMSDILLIFSHVGFTMQVWICVVISVVVLVYNIVTPVTLTVMTLERYVAICMPLRHAELCSTRSTMHCILIIHGLSSVPCIVVLSTFFASASLGFYKHNRLCTVEIFMLHRWQDHVRSAVQQFYFLIMVIIILFSYVKIMKVAKAASGEDKKSSWKGLKTVILHGFQLLLCLIQLWCPFLETAALQIDFALFIDIRYVNYIFFNLTPRCLSPLIYGLRDETFFHSLKNLFGFYKRNI